MLEGEADDAEVGGPAVLCGGVVGMLGWWRGGVVLEGEADDA